MPLAQRPDVLIVSLGSTEGLRVADRQLRDSLVRTGASVVLVTAAPPAPARTMMLTDLGWARASRAAAAKALAELRDSPPKSIVYSSTTAALLWPRRGAIRFDAPSAGNRPGRHGLWQRPLERRRLAETPLLLPWSEGGLSEVPPQARGAGRELVLPVAVDASGPPAPVRDIAAITYAANPKKKGLDRVLAAWRYLRRTGSSEELLVAGVSLEDLRVAGIAASPGDGVRVVGALPSADYRELLRRARIFVCAPRREDYGVAQLEALADGCMLVTTPAPGPFVALPLARSLDPRLVSDDLAAALRVATSDPHKGYQAGAREALRRFGQQEIDRQVARELLPRLLSSTA